MSEPIIEYREEFNITDIARKYAERVARVIDEQTLANVENQLAEYGYVKVVRCRDCMYVDKVGYWCAHPSRTFIDEYGMEICNKAEPDGFCAWGKRKEGGDDKWKEN